jgi:hypothetical protein
MENSSVKGIGAMQKMGLYLLIVLAVLLVATPMEATPKDATPTEAENWECIRSNAEYIVYVDAKSVSGGTNGPKDAWFKEEYKSPICSSDYAIKNKKCIESAFVYTRYFSNKTSCVLKTVATFADGTKDSFETACSPKKITPDSMGESVWIYLYE